ncbi:hypothetical protein ACP3V3_01815 [Vibrio sp. PNB22_3_1]
MSNARTRLTLSREDHDRFDGWINDCVETVDVAIARRLLDWKVTSPISNVLTLLAASSDGVDEHVWPLHFQSGRVLYLGFHHLRTTQVSKTSFLRIYEFLGDLVLVAFEKGSDLGEPVALVDAREFLLLCERQSLMLGAVKSYPSYFPMLCCGFHLHQLHDLFVVGASEVVLDGVALSLSVHPDVKALVAEKALKFDGHYQLLEVSADVYALQYLYVGSRVGVTVAFVALPNVAQWQCL